jgi:hypothetical protein
MAKRVPELSSIIDSIILTNDIELPREYSFDSVSKKEYQCPNCLRLFKTYKINDNRQRQYIRQSAQARRHYTRLTCINRFKLVSKGYLRNDKLEKRMSKYKAFQSKPMLSNATKYLLGIDIYKPNPLQLVIYGLLTDTITLRPSIKFYKPKIKYHIRVRMNHIVSCENRRAVSIVPLGVDINGKIQNVSMDIPKFSERKDVEVFVDERLRLMSQYFRPLECMKTMPSIWNSETLRPLQKELNIDMRDYLNIIDPNGITIPIANMVGLLSQ